MNCPSEACNSGKSPAPALTELETERRCMVCSYTEPKTPRDLEREEQTARAIMQQLGGSSRLKVMIGATNIYRDRGALQFRFKGSQLFNAVVISLDENDTYTIRFKKLDRGSHLQAEKTFTNIYADGLVALFEETTGLRLKLK